MEPKKINPEQKYQCRICNKGFSWGRDYEEHIRTHGLKDEIIIEKEERLPTAVAGGDSAADMPSYNREFLPWNSYFKRDYRSSSTAAAAAGNDDDGRDGLIPPSPPCPSYKGKRIERDGENCGSTDRQTQSRTQEEDVARFLVELSKACLERAPVSNQNHPATTVGYECDNCNKVFPSHQALGGHRAAHKNVKGCSAVSLEIRSAGTNNKIKNQNNNVDNQNNMVRSPENMTLSIVPLTEYSPRRPSSPMKYPKPHKCRKCPREFPTGQALGGHMRCHWITLKITTTAATTTASTTSVNSTTIAAAPASATATIYTPNAQIGASSSEVNEIQLRRPTLPLLFKNPRLNLGLNMPVEPTDDMDGSSLQLCFSEVKSPQHGWEREPKRKMDLGDLAAEPTDDMDRSSLQLCFSDVKSLQHGWEREPKRKNDLGDLAAESTDDMDRSLLQLCFSDLKSPQHEWERKSKKKKDLSDLRNSDDEDGKTPWLRLGIGSKSDEEGEHDSEGH
ncbi:uncharacterized protein LOC110029384 [Phalaenopsis equestris]|uniref:uncharacterized protein LOC110029384 n=1 Tax=Phalaenopsis equestris TaxID=78828 RepID=UPI0009E648F7|nr:uncharacterized protein LOC110029384 [Phalaenopsis equestris]